MFKFKAKVGTILATRNHLTEYEIEKVHDNGYTVVEAHMSPTHRRIARRYKVDFDDLIPVQSTAQLPSMAA